MPNLAKPSAHDGRAEENRAPTQSANRTSEERVSKTPSKLLRPLLAYWARSIISTVERFVQLAHEPLSRKVLRL
ncbi:hypothetical protein ANAPC5_01417 [Anaplasma phagocytophilum]|nr:hypothetical protein ANAPC5_01417 [Anaplasma phagocytophilum]